MNKIKDLSKNWRSIITSLFRNKRKDEYNWLGYRDFEWALKNNGFEIQNPPSTWELIYKQHEEDNLHYYAYEKQRILYDKTKTKQEYAKTKDYIKNNPTVLGLVEQKDIHDAERDYAKYEKMCDKLSEKNRLTIKEFVVLRNNPLQCRSFKILFIQPLGVYNIYYNDIARYANTNMRRLIELEFKEKWY